MKGEKCCVPTGNSWTPSKCGKPAKVEVNGKFYCGVHDPIKAAARKASRDEEWRQEQKALARRCRIKAIETEIGRIVLGEAEGDIEALKAEYHKLNVESLANEFDLCNDLARYEGTLSERILAALADKLEEVARG